MQGIRSYDPAVMNNHLSCYRCGHSLRTLPLPLGRRDECPNCVAELHVCLMCQMYDPREPNECTEEDALEVMDKEHANFCDYYKPNPDAYSPGFMEAHTQAESDLAALFGDIPPDTAADKPANGAPGKVGEDDTLSSTEDLFKS